MSDVTHKGFEIRPRWAGPIAVIALIVKEGAIVHSVTQPSELGAVESAKRWVDELGSLPREIDDAVLQSGRSGGQTILQGVTIEGGLVVNDLGADADARFEADAEPNLLFLDAGADSGAGRVGIGTATPANRLHVRESSASERVSGQFENAGGGAVQFRLVTSARAWALRQTTAALAFRDITGAVEPLVLLNGAPTNSIRVDANGVGLFGVGSFGGGVGVLFLANRTTAPSSNPVAGGIPYTEAGALKYRGSSGTITILAPA